MMLSKIKESYKDTTVDQMKSMIEDGVEVEEATIEITVHKDSSISLKIISAEKEFNIEIKKVNDFY